MPATNYTPIQLYRSTTSGNIPSAANLSAGEIALNIADNDMTMYFENASGTVKSFFNNPAALKYPTADGTSGHVLKTDGAGVLSFGAAPVTNTALTNNTRQAVTSSATTTIDLNSGNVIDLTMAANITTLSFTNVPASGTPILVQIIVKGAADGTYYNIYWPSSIYWNAYGSSQSQVAPALAQGANSVTVIALLTTDGGTKWRGWTEAVIPGGFANTLYISGYAAGNLTTKRSSPIQLFARNNWVQMAGNLSTVFGLDAIGRLWVWGSNGSGQFGNGLRATVAPYGNSSPIQVGEQTNWTFVESNGNSVLAINTNGNLFAWGSNNNGELGLNDNTGKSSPIQVGTNTWKLVNMGAAFTLALDTSGKLWSWGLNLRGVLGQGDTVARSSPTQIGALTTWATVGSSRYAGFAINTSGQLFSWGSNKGGQLGQNNTVYRSSPVQVGALTSWQSVTAMDGGTTALFATNSSVNPA